MTTEHTLYNDTIIVIKIEWLVKAGITHDLSSVILFHEDFRVTEKQNFK